MSLIVLGMHRSGTSIITSLINSMGAYVGAPGELLEASPDNPRGFFERKDVVNLNRAIMQQHQCNWYQLQHWEEPALPLQENIALHMNHLTNHLQLNAPYVIKDPRLCLTLPYWLRFIENPVIVMASRHPLAIARSLELRNQMPIEMGLALWEYHAVYALNQSHGLRVVHANYEALLEAPKREAERLYDALKEWVPSLTPPDVTLIEPSLERAQSISHTLTSSQQRLYAMLRGEEKIMGEIQISETARRVMQQP